MTPFDAVVLTAANEAQAAGYRAQLEWRKKNGLLPENILALAISDPGGRRVGSLGATLHVIDTLQKQLGTLDGKRILLCHSGGDSRRTPAYAAQGKVFTPVPCSENGKPLALFDLILRTSAELPKPQDGHILVVSGDVLLTFDQASADLSSGGMTGVAYYGPAETGAKHGVYVPENFSDNPARTVCTPVGDFLQKPSTEEALAANAVDAYGHVAIDTGILSLSPQLCRKLLSHASKGLLDEIRSGTCPPLDLYEELCMALTPAFGERRFLERCVYAKGLDKDHAKRMAAFRRSLKGVEFRVNIVPYCEFFHIGSSAELLGGFSGLSRTAQLYGFTNGNAASVSSRDGDTGGAFVFNSHIQVPLKTKGTVLAEGVDARGKTLSFDGGNILTGLPPEASIPVHLPKDLGLVVMPVGKKNWAAVLYGIRDTFKQPAGTCTFLNEPLTAWMQRASVATLWSNGEEKDGLWRAKLWRCCPVDEAIAEALAMAEGKFVKGGKRFSLCELIPLVNHARLLAMRQEIQRQVDLVNIAERIERDDTYSTAEAVAQIHSDKEKALVLDRLAPLAKSPQPLLRARALATVAAVKGEEQPWDAFRAVAEAVAVDFALPDKPGRAAVLPDQVVWTTTPVRIDLAGGWSDTPPICTERGGCVLNAAVTLNGLYPIQVMAKLNDRNTIRLSSIDLGERKEIRTSAELLDHHDPHDWGALAKAAAVIAGIGPSDEKEDLGEWLKSFGGGLDLTIFSSLPKGSGMGTSSILGAAVLACLDRVSGISFNRDRIIRMTSILEQRMCTGGGWQDQVGGIMPGVKLLRTEPGPEQSVALRWSDCEMAEEGEFRSRCLLYFTGQKRMARNILQNVVGNWLRRDPKTVRLVDELKQNAAAAKEALDARDIDAFAECVHTYWEQKKAIDPGATNEPIEKLLASVAKETSAALLPGAGGGGFIFIVAKSPAAAQRIRERFTSAPLHPHSRFFDFAIDRQGMKTTVL